MVAPKFLTSSSSEVHLEAEVADRRVPTFLSQYEAETGIKLKPGKNFHVISSANDGKRGLEGRVYFNGDSSEIAQLKKLGYRVQGPRSKGYLSDRYSFRIDLNSLFWDLVRAGHRI